MSISLAISPRVSRLRSAGLLQFSHNLQVATHGKGLYELTDAVAQWLGGRDVRQERPDMPHVLNNR